MQIEPRGTSRIEENLQTTRHLTAAQRTLLLIMREHRFGRIENLVIRSGQPVLERATRLVRVARLGNKGDGSATPITDEFEVKQAVRDLFQELASLHDGTVVRLEFKHGLPFLLEVQLGALT